MGPLLACMVLALLPLRARTWSLLAGPVLGCIAGVVAARSPVASAWTSSCSFLATMILPMLSVYLGNEGRANMDGNQVQPSRHHG